MSKYVKISQRFILAKTIKSILLKYPTYFCLTYSTHSNMQL